MQLTTDNRCKLFGLAERPAFCVGLRPSEEMCGKTAEEALQWLTRLESLTTPTAGSMDLKLGGNRLPKIAGTPETLD